MSPSKDKLFIENLWACKRNMGIMLQNKVAHFYGSQCTYTV